MKDLNRIILIGRLGSDPVRRETRAGLAVTHFSLATSRRVKNVAQEQVTMNQMEADAENGGGESYDLPGSRALTVMRSDGESGWAEETVWHRVVAWGRIAENCARYLKKGALVSVEGSMRSRKYEGKDGVTRMTFEVHADNVGFLGGVPRRDSLDDMTSVAEAV